MEVARGMLELSSRQLAAWITDHRGFSVSESTVYRILKREGLIKSPEMRLAAGTEYHRSTTAPHQMWATDASYFKVIGTVKRDVYQMPYELPSELERAIADFVDYYNHRRYHKALGNVTPADVLEGRRDQIQQRRKAVQAQTIRNRRQRNQSFKKLVATSSSASCVRFKTVPFLLGLPTRLHELLQPRIVRPRLDRLPATQVPHRGLPPEPF